MFDEFAKCIATVFIKWNPGISSKFPLRQRRPVMEGVTVVSLRINLPNTVTL